MRNKNEIVKDLEAMNDKNKAGEMNDFEFRMVEEAIKIEVLCDIRDLLKEMNNAMWLEK